MDFIHSREGSSPILLEMPHSGHIGINSLDGVPAVLAAKMRFDSQAVRTTIGFGCDAAVPEMSGYDDLIESLDASGLRDELARVYCDVNRDKGDGSNHGVIWGRTLVTDIDMTLPPDEVAKLARAKSENMLTSPLTAEEFSTLMTQVYDPYHTALRAHHQRIVAKHGRCVHLALHSLPPVSITTVDGGYVCGAPIERGTDVILIHNNFAAADRTVIETLRREFQAAGLTVQDGQGPFVGDRGVTALYGKPDQGVHVVGIEHIAHGIETRRHLGDPSIDTDRARTFQAAYRSAITALL